jgi:hypothetical protein
MTFYNGILEGFDIVFGGGIFARIANKKIFATAPGFIFNINMGLSFLLLNGVTLLRTTLFTFAPDTFKLRTDSVFLNTLIERFNLAALIGTSYFYAQGFLTLYYFFKGTKNPHVETFVKIFVGGITIGGLLYKLFPTTRVSSFLTDISNVLKGASYVKAIISCFYIIPRVYFLFVKNHTEPLIGDFKLGSHTNLFSLLVMSGQELTIFKKNLPLSADLNSFEKLGRYMVAGRLYLLIAFGMVYVEKVLRKGLFSFSPTYQAVLNVGKLIFLFSSFYSLTVIYFDDRFTLFLNESTAVVDNNNLFKYRLMFICTTAFIVIGSPLRYFSMFVNMFVQLAAPILNRYYVVTGTVVISTVIIRALSFYYIKYIHGADEDAGLESEQQPITSDLQTN